MIQTKKAGFTKSLACPTSDQLLAFHLGGCTEYQAETVAQHLEKCDFCAAELDLYRHCPSSADDNVHIDKIPIHLYQLAEALLNNRTSGTNALQALLDAGPSNDKDLS